MDLDVAQDILGVMGRFADARRIQTEAVQRFGHGDAFCIRLVEQHGIERSGDRAAAQQRGIKAHSFLIGEADHLDGEGQVSTDLMQRFHARDRRDNAKHAIVLAGVAHGIEVRTGQYCRQAGPKTLIATNDIADGIEPGLHARLFHPAFDQLAGGLMLWRQEVPGERPAVMRDGPELLKPGHDFRAKA